MSRILDLAEQLSAARLANNAATIHVDDVNEAVALATHLTTTGRDYWFRGQTVNWPKLSATYYRLNQEGKDDAMERLYRFERWAKATPGLERIAASYDAMIAVTQHYGLPTTFLDFTTDPTVAGFFASVDSKPIEQGTEGCIYCLDLEVADSTWEAVKDALGADYAVERLEMPVPNLWRLEAQRGVFIWSQYEDLNQPFPLDRIVFPYKAAVAAPLVHDIYPVRESPLEARLREYFQNEEISQGTQWLKQEMKDAPGLFHDLPFDSPAYEPDVFEEQPTPHPSWQPDRLAPWLQIRVEPWHALALATPLQFALRDEESPEDSADRLRHLVQSKLSQTPNLRDSPVTWTLSSSDPNFDRKLAPALQNIWDEMARLPWPDEALATALSGAVLWALTSRQFAEIHQFGMEIERATAAHRMTQPIRVEIGGHYNAHNWAWMEESDLLEAIREDFFDLLRPDYRPRVLGNAFNSMMSARTPALLFDFDRLSRLFSKTLIPTQAIFNPALPLFATRQEPKLSDRNDSRKIQTITGGRQLRSRKLFNSTLTELKAIAPAAIQGVSVK